MNFDDVLMKYKFQTALPYLKPDYLLDVGCGTGHFIYLLNRFYPRANFWGMDLDCEKLKIARKFVKGTFYCCEFERAVYSNEWETITAFNILEHTEDHGVFLKLCYESLVDNGRLIITVPNATALHKRIGVLMDISEPYQLTEADIEKGHKHTYSISFLKGIMKDVGFRIRAVKGVFLKPFPSDVMMQHYSPELFDALYELGKELPEYCSSIMVVGEKR